MSEKQEQPETCIMINDTSQRSVVTWFRCGGTFDHYFTKIYCWVCFERVFKIAQHLAEL